MLLLRTATEDVLGAVSGASDRPASQRVSFGGGLKLYADAPDNAPEWGIRAFITLLYPR